MKEVYKAFISDCLDQIGDDNKEKYMFKIKRKSREIPCWCIFFCKRSTQEISLTLEYHILDSEEKENLTMLLDTLVESGVPAKISYGYYIGIIDEKLY